PSGSSTPAPRTAIRPCQRASAASVPGRLARIGSVSQKMISSMLMSVAGVAAEARGEVGGQQPEQDRPFERHRDGGDAGDQQHAALAPVAAPALPPQVPYAGEVDQPP